MADKLGGLINQFKRRLTTVCRLLLDLSSRKIQNVAAITDSQISFNLNAISQPMREGHSNLLKEKFLI